MVTKGIITELVGTTQAKVRIPLYDKASSAVDATPDSELSVAIMCTFPGGAPNYSVGDVVIIAFEQDIYDEPVIIGLLFTGNLDKTFTDMNIGRLTVNNSARLPHDTYIGTISPFDIQNLAGTRGNLQNQIDDLTAGGGGGSGRVPQPAIVGQAIVGLDYVHDPIGYHIDAENRNLIFIGLQEINDIDSQETLDPGE